jgi:hypothetical protein
MNRTLRLLVAAALNVMVGAGVATAQTVVVRHASPGDTVELFLNATKVATGTVDPKGDVTMALNLRQNNAGKEEADANIFIDACDKLRRVVVVERGQAIAAQEPGCERRDIQGLYGVRRVHTLVVDVGGVNPTMMLIKGGYGLEAERTWGAPSGLVVFGGTGLTSFRDAALIFCGTGASCSDKIKGFGYTAGATVWIKRYFGIEGGYFKPRRTTATGSGTNFSFDSKLDADVITGAGVAGIPIGPVRLYGKGGATYAFETSTTVQTISGQSQTFVVDTRGWGWVAGGGLEIWVAPAAGLFVDGGFAWLKGDPVGGGEALFNDRLRYINFGVRVRIGR